MKTESKSIVLIDWLLERVINEVENLNYRKDSFVVFDPVNLFSELDWTKYEDDSEVVNRIYSRLFENVVMNHKKLICFWPLAQQLGEDWFELASLCEANNYELELYKSKAIDDSSYGLNDGILRSWKSLVYLMLESLLEDIKLNEQFDEIATLKSSQKTIILFKLVQEDVVRYSYSFDSEFFELIPYETLDPIRNENHTKSFGTFIEMLEYLAKDIDLGSFDPKFVDGSMEKAYFNILSKEFKTNNLIENWFKMYSMN